MVSACSNMAVWYFLVFHGDDINCEVKMDVEGLVPRTVRRINRGISILQNQLREIYLESLI
jgi:hypothetical protein